MNLTQPLRPKYFEPVEKQLERIFYAILFQPILEVLDGLTAQAAAARRDFFNAREDALRAALRSGRVQYRDGVFSGQFSAEISKALKGIGATFDSRGNVFKLDNAPNWVLSETAAFRERAQKAHEEVKKTLGYVQDTLDQLTEKHQVDALPTVSAIESDFKGIARELQVSPELTDASRQRLANDYTQNMELWIKKWIEEEIVTLRGVVDENAMEGYRFDRLIERIKHQFNVSQSKAKFLARQETGLFMAKFRRERFKESGVRRYKWSTARDERVRDDHKHLNGRIFFYADPPIVDTTTGRRANPGEDFNCRCVDIPILDPIEADKVSA